jgi:hypothetical protein
MVGAASSAWIRQPHWSPRRSSAVCLAGLVQPMMISVWTALTRVARLGPERILRSILQVIEASM